MRPTQSRAVSPDGDAADEAWDDDSLPYAYGAPPATGRIKVQPDDFIVDEVLAFPLAHEGEHRYLRIEKVGENTEYVARMLARLAGVPLLDVGYAGLKDRHARTRQWFSVGLAGKPEPDWSALDGSMIRIIEAARHRRKLRRGDLAGNRFRITVRSLSGPRDAIEERLSRIGGGGVPNYFGAQRFGHHGANLTAAREFLRGKLKPASRHERSLYLSAARSYLFNRILARRVEAGCWNRAIAGDVFISDLDDRPTNRLPDRTDPAEPIRSLALHPAGTLWGRGKSLLGTQALALEHEALQDCGDLCQALEDMGLKRAMRALRVPVTDLVWTFPDQANLELQFMLPPGAYATSVLREIIGDV